MPEPLLAPGLSEDASLEHHLRYNHFPAVNPTWIPAAKAAIDAAVNAVEVCDETGEVWEMDNAVLREPLEGFPTNLSVGEIMDGLHLWSFVTWRLAAQVEVELEPKQGE